MSKKYYSRIPLICCQTICNKKSRTFKTNKMVNGEKYYLTANILKHKRCLSNQN